MAGGRLTSMVEDEDLKDQSYDRMLFKIGGGIQGKDLRTHVHEPVGKPVPHRLDVSGRLPSSALRVILEQCPPGLAPGGAQVVYLMERHKVDPDTLAKVLHYVCLPLMYEAPGQKGVEAFADWPDGLSGQQVGPQEEQGGRDAWQR